MNSTSLPVLTVKGSPTSMGEQHGRTMSKRICDLAKIRKTLLLKESGVDITHLKTVAEQAWINICSAIPCIAEEIEATAHAAQISTWELVIAGAYSDIADVLRADLECLSECTVGIDPLRFQIFGTWDSHCDAVDYALILKRLPNNGEATIALTTAGWPVQFGVNSGGLSFGITNLTPRKTSLSGLPYIAAIAKAATLSRTTDAIEWLTSQTFMSGHSYIFMDIEEKAAVLETTAENKSLKFLEEAFVQTNHYLSSIDDNFRYAFLEGSKVRRSEMSEYLTSFSDADSFLTWLKCHPKVFRQALPGSSFASCAIYNIDIKKKTLSVSSLYDYMSGMASFSL